MRGVLVFVIALAAACSFDPPPDVGDDDNGDVDAMPTEFSVAVAPPGFVRPGGTADVTITVNRDAGFTDDVTVELVDLPTGVTAATLTLTAADPSGTIRIEADASATIGDFQPEAHGTAADLLRTARFDLVVAGVSATVDTTFGTDGIASPPGSLPQESAARRVFRLADGSFLVCGFLAAGDLVIARFARDGTLDADFGTDGVARIATPGRGGGTCTMAPDGSLVFASAYDANPDSNVVDSDIVLARVRADGTPDPDFGTDGIVAIADTTRNISSAAVTLDAQGRIIVTGAWGHADNQGATTGVHVSRFRADGSADTGFASQGTHTGPSNVNERGTDVWVRSDGVILATTEGIGKADYSVTPPALVALRDSGAIVIELGGGHLTLPTTATQPGGTAAKIVPLPDGTLMVVGSVVAGSLASPDAALWHITATGVDTGFGASGVVVHHIDDRAMTYMAGVVVDADRFVALGTDAASGIVEPTSGMAVWLSTATGEIDATVGTNGRVFVAPDADTYQFHNYADGVAGPDGRLTAVMSLGNFNAMGTFRAARFWY